MMQEEMLGQLKDACWIGEDGDAAIYCNNKRKAFSAFKSLMREDVGDWEAREMKIGNVGIGYAALFTDEDILGQGYEDVAWFRENESEWYVSWAENAKGIKVYVWHGNN